MITISYNAIIDSAPAIIKDKRKQATIQFIKSNTTKQSSSTSSTALTSDAPPISVDTSSTSSKVMEQAAVSTTVA